jgi:hypothetical protein
MTALPFWAPLALLGFAPWMILAQQAISLIYQFWIHTERVRKMPAWFEYFFNTPSHHRVHHGANEIYTRVSFHEFADLARDVRDAASWRERLGYVFRGPGWSPDGTGGGTRG